MRHRWLDSVLLNLLTYDWFKCRPVSSLFKIILLRVLFCGTNSEYSEKESIKKRMLFPLQSPIVMAHIRYIKMVTLHRGFRPYRPTCREEAKVLDKIACLWYLVFSEKIEQWEKSRSYVTVLIYRTWTIPNSQNKTTSFIKLFARGMCANFLEISKTCPYHMHP